MNTAIPKEYNNVQFLLILMVFVTVVSGLTSYVLRSYFYHTISSYPLTVVRIQPASTTGKVCAQVLTRACSIASPNECKTFGTPCDIPAGWAAQ